MFYYRKSQMIFKNMKSGDWESGFFLSILVKLSVANLFSYWPEKDFIFSKLDC